MAKRINVKIGYMNNSDLPPLRNLSGGHYVYIKKKKGKTSLHTIKSIVVNKRTGETRYIGEKN